MRLTPAGEALCTKVFSQHLDYLRPAFSSLDDRFMAELTGSMQKLRKALQQYGKAIRRKTSSNFIITINVLIYMFLLKTDRSILHPNPKLFS